MEKKVYSKEQTYDISLAYITEIIRKYKHVTEIMIDNYNDYKKDGNKLIKFLSKYAYEIDNAYNIENNMQSIEPYDENKYNKSFLDDIYYLLVLKNTPTWKYNNFIKKLELIHDAWTIHYLNQINDGDGNCDGDGDNINGKETFTFSSKGEYEEGESTIFTVDNVDYVVNNVRLYDKRQFLPYDLLDEDQQLLDYNTLKKSKKYYTEIIQLKMF